jgi:hypothetical protein
MWLGCGGSDDKRIDLIAFGAASAGDVDTLAARLGRSGVQLVSEPNVRNFIADWVADEFGAQGGHR